MEKKEDNKGKQPVIIDRENTVKKFISDNQLATYYCLCQSSYYKTIEIKFNEVVKNSVVENIPQKFQNVILDIVNNINVVVNGFNINNIVFKNYGMNVNKDFVILIMELFIFHLLYFKII